MNTKVILLLIFSLLVQYTNAQSYEMSPEFMKDLELDSFAKEIKVLHFKEHIQPKGRASMPKVQDLKKLHNLVELQFDAWIYGHRLDTNIRFDIETFEQLIGLYELPQKVNVQQLIELLPAYPKLEVLSLSFDNQWSWASMHDYYLLSVYDILETDLEPCMKGKRLMDLYRARAYAIWDWSRIIDDEPLRYDISPLNELESPKRCVDAAFIEKWKSYLLFEGNIDNIADHYKKDGWEYLAHFIPAAKLEALKKQYADIPELLQLEKIAAQRQFYLRQEAKKGLRNLGLKGLSPAEQLASQITKLPKLKVVEIRDYPDLQDELPQLLKALSKLPKLEILKLEHCKLDRIPKEIALLKNLKALYLNHNQFQEVGRGLDQLPNLEILDLSHNPILQYKEAFYQIPKLQELHLNYCPLLPDRIEEMSQLSVLSLEGIPILEVKDFSSKLQKLYQLHHLNLKSTGLTEIPFTIKYLRNLEVLNLANNQLQYWPLDFATWPEMMVNVEANFLPALEEETRPKLRGLDLQWKYELSAFSHRQLPKNHPIRWQKTKDKSNFYSLSPCQNIYIEQQALTSNENGFDFQGTLKLPSASIKTNKASYKNKSHSIQLDYVKDLELYLPARKRSPEGRANGFPYPFKEQLASRIQNFHASLIIDADYNTFGQWEHDPKYPLLKSLDSAYVYYPVYDSSQFYVALAPFELQGLDSLKLDGIGFSAVLNTPKILPPFACSLAVMPHDLSLGFEQKVENLGFYWNDQAEAILQLTGLLELSNEGLLARGELKTKDWTAKADYIKFEMDRVFVQAKQLKVKKGKKRKEVQLLYYPYENRWLVSKQLLPFSLLSVATDDLELEAELLHWPIPSSRGKHFVELSQLLKASSNQFQTEGEMTVACYLPLALANVILADFNAATLDQLDKEEPAFIFNNLKMYWEEKDEFILSQSGSNLSEQIRLNAIAGQIVDRPLEAKIRIQPQKTGDLFEWYFEKKAGDWYYFRLMNNELQTLSSNPIYNEAVANLKKKERLSKLAKRKKFEIKLAKSLPNFKQN